MFLFDSNLCFSSVASGLELVDEPGLHVLYEEWAMLPVLWLSGNRFKLEQIKLHISKTSTYINALKSAYYQ